MPVSPLLRAQDQQDVADFVRFQQTAAQTFGPEFTPTLYNQDAVVQFLASKFGIPEDLLADPETKRANIEQLAQLAQQHGMVSGG